MGKRAERPATSNDDRHDTLKQLRIFCETARQGTMTAAARSLGMSQPAVSTQMRRLEQRFDLTLFTRKGPSVVPSAVGHASTPVRPGPGTAPSASPSAATDAREQDRPEEHRRRAR